jgi:two-component sensor histidine kinase
MDAAERLCVLVCDRFAREAKQASADAGYDELTVLTIPARCGRPPLAWAELDALAGEHDRTHLLGCSCCLPQIDSVPPRLRDVRTERMAQCFYLIAGQRLVDTYLQQGAYLLTPGWLSSWRERLKEDGLDRESARALHASSTQLVLLDTGVDSDSPQQLQELSAHLARPATTIPVGLDHLRLRLDKQVLEWRLDHRRRQLEGAVSAARGKVSDYAMAFDLLQSLTRTLSEKEVSNKVLDLFTALFAPERLHYLTWHDGQPQELRSSYPTGVQPVEPGLVRAVMTSLELEQNHALTEHGDGFILRIMSPEETVAVLMVDRITFPEQINRYLNLAISITGVCALAIANARAFEKLRRAEEQMAASLEEKEVLLREIHHRVKNNMQVIISLLRLQAQQISDDKVQTALAESQNRVRAMALVHESLHDSGNLARINLQQYLSGLAEGLTGSFGIGSGRPEIAVTVGTPDLLIDIDQAVPIGLVINELVTNAMEHAFPKNTRGKIRISVQELDQGRIELVVQDNGIGLPEDAGQKSSSGLGLKLVQRIVENQLKGRYSIEKRNGTRFVVAFELA